MMIHFIRPFWLWLWIPSLIYLIWILWKQRQNNPWKNMCDPHLLAVLIEKNPHSSRLLFTIALFCFVLISIFALGGPSWKKTELPIYQEIHSVMLILDLSTAMQETDLKPDRLSRAKFKIRDFIHSAQNTEVGLVVFTEEAFVASPLSQDAKTLDNLLDALYPQMMPILGSDIGQGLAEGLHLLKQAKVANSNVLLITGSDPTAKSWVAAKNIVEAGYHLHILGMLESNNATQTTITKLKKLAEVGEGSFYLFTQDGADIEAILQNNDTKQIMHNETVEKAYLWEDRGPWFCLLLVPFALIILREKLQYEKNR